MTRSNSPHDPVRTRFPVVIVGAGPIGLAAAAHLIERGETPVVLEAGPSAGTSLRTWSHVRLFSPWRYNLDRASVALLEDTGWSAPDPEAYPTGGDVVRDYLEPLAATDALRDAIRYRTRVTGIARSRMGKVRTGGRGDVPFDIHVETPEGENVVRARAVIDASGTWHTPSWAGGNGLPALGEREASDRIVYGIPDVLGRDRKRYAGKRTLVVGSGHSAFQVLLDLSALASDEPATRPVWALRRSRFGDVFGGGDRDALPARGALGARLQSEARGGRLEVHRGVVVERIERDGNHLVVAGGEHCITGIDEIVVATGSRPDVGMLRELRVSLDPALECASALAPMIDPNVHGCGSVRPHGEGELRNPEPDFYVAGVKSYGRAPTFLLMTGYEQVRSIVAALAGDMVAAADVRLVLPETGVCLGGGPDVPPLIVEPRASARCDPGETVTATSCCGASSPL